MCIGWTGRGGSERIMDKEGGSVGRICVGWRERRKGVWRKGGNTSVRTKKELEKEEKWRRMQWMKAL